ncbi:MAG: glycosyltransferase family 9 protein [Flavisolibacter sp.]|nr:glycosyltransferase family 9 protein [Flavisolibacter sp.]
MKLQPSEIKKIAVFRALQLGDMLCAVPALRALHHAYPEAEITLLGLPWAQSLVDRFPDYIHSFKHFPGYPGLPEQQLHPKTFTAFLEDVQSEEYDLVLQMQGNGSIVNPMIELFGGKYPAGFCLENDYCPDKNLFLTYPTGIHEIERHLALMKHLGIESAGKQMEFPLYKKDYDDLEALTFSIPQKKYVCVHPGSRGTWRQWPPKYFAELANYCSQQNLKVVLTGTKGELHIVDEVKKHLVEDPLVAAGKTSIGAVGVLIKNAALLISNCTGVSHMAAAFETPSIVISMDGEPERWAPLNRQLHRTIDWTKTPEFNSVYDQLKDLLTCLQRDHSRNKTITITNQNIPD